MKSKLFLLLAPIFMVVAADPHFEADDVGNLSGRSMTMAAKWISKAAQVKKVTGITEIECKLRKEAQCIAAMEQMLKLKPEFDFLKGSKVRLTDSLIRTDSSLWINLDAEYFDDARNRKTILGNATYEIERVKQYQKLTAALKTKYNLKSISCEEFYINLEDCLRSLEVVNKSAELAPLMAGKNIQISDKTTLRDNTYLFKKFSSSAEMAQYLKMLQSL